MESDSDHDVVIVHFSSSDSSESEASNSEEHNCNIISHQDVTCRLHIRDIVTAFSTDSFE